jgi:hypothetical protein
MNNTNETQLESDSTTEEHHQAFTTRALHHSFSNASHEPASQSSQQLDVSAKRQVSSVDFSDQNSVTKRPKLETSNSFDDGVIDSSLNFDPEDDSGPPAINASDEGVTTFNDYDVLSGRGGGTNVHPGNRNFRDLINLHRRAYLKARKNDKPAISRAIVRSIRENNGKFLRKDEASGMWFEIGDDAAREKTSQALRQRAPEMRKLLFDTEREEARAADEQNIHPQLFMMSGGGIPMVPGSTMGPAVTSAIAPGVIQGIVPVIQPVIAVVPTGQQILANPMLFHAIANGGAQFFSPALLGQGMNQFTTNGS